MNIINNYCRCNREDGVPGEQTCPTKGKSCKKAFSFSNDLINCDSKAALKCNCKLISVLSGRFMVGGKGSIKFFSRIMQIMSGIRINSPYSNSPVLSKNSVVLQKTAYFAENIKPSSVPKERFFQEIPLSKWAVDLGKESKSSRDFKPFSAVLAASFVWDAKANKVFKVSEFIVEILDKVIRAYPEMIFAMPRPMLFGDYWPGTSIVSPEILALILEQMVSYTPITSYMSSSSKKRLFMTRVRPSSKKWDIFLQWSGEYLQETWPEKHEDKTIPEIIAEYEQELLERISEGERGLYILQQEGEDIGFINVYLQDRKKPGEEEEVSTLHIAEFYIRPEFRGQGLGSSFIDLIRDWMTKKQFAKMLWVEVDKELLASNKFWGSQNQNLLKKERNIYWANLDS